MVQKHINAMQSRLLVKGLFYGDCN